MSEGSVFEGDVGGESEKISERALLVEEEEEGEVEGGVKAMVRVNLFDTLVLHCGDV